ncbi:MAG: hypothetical protein MnENMB40S_28830 [Rhizobiaceae bacterium MnEN-MB40S]|nr:MAG: hypothetical protein MnENMB40S_28830 [Rhizobiaceae bacterium MnEN-MB40S]
MEGLDFDNGEAVAISLCIMPEQLERLQHFADQAKVSLARFLREGAELLAAEMARVQSNSDDERNTAVRIH